MTTIALIGADGAGKTTVARALQHRADPPVLYVYLGVSATSSTHVLPTTRLVRWIKRRRGIVEDNGPPASVREVGTPVRRRGVVGELRAAARLTNRVAEEWYRQYVAWRAQRRGLTVVFDRHYLADFSSHDLRRDVRLSWDRRIHGALLRRFYPRPDAVVFLDADPAVLLARKGEGSLDDLARRRADYAALADQVERFEVVDAARPLEVVVEDVATIVTRLARAAA